MSDRGCRWSMAPTVVQDDEDENAMRELFRVLRDARERASDPMIRETARRCIDILARQGTQHGEMHARIHMVEKMLSNITELVGALIKRLMEAGIDFSDIGQMLTPSSPKPPGETN